jgi:pimeloyl-ACP methyl ester carboxylesterase
MTQTDVVGRDSAERSGFVRVAPVAIILGGLSMAAFFVPFTMAHGPTSYNEEHHILGWDMHAWGFLLGVLPNVLIAGGLWRLREWMTGGRRSAKAILAVGCAGLLLDALMNLAFRALGAPFVLFLLVPTSMALAILIPTGDPARARTRVAVAALGMVLATGLAVALIPQETSDSFGGFRIFGTVVYGLGGLLWALLGLSLRPRRMPLRLAAAPGQPHTSRFVLVVALALAMASCTSSPHGEPTAIEWGDCAAVTDVHAWSILPERAGRLEFRCGTLDVALDPAHTETGTLRMQLIRAHQSGGAATKGILLLLAGGPGQSGVDSAGDLVSLLPNRLLDQFDVVAFDPRGVGHSQPIRCQHHDSGRPTFRDLLSPAGYDQAASEMRQYIDECATALGSKASLFSTTATAVDIDRIRAALDQPTLTYLGWSYGAKLGGEYARLYPDRVRAAVLDAPSNPTTTWIDTAERQIAGFEDTFDQFAAWCAAQGRCDAIGDVRTFVLDLVAEAEELPIPSGRPGDDIPTYGFDILDAVAGAMYDDVRWPDLADGLVEARNGDSGTLRGLVDAFRGDEDHPNVSDALLVINCNDSAPGPSEAEIKAAGARFAKQFPLFGVWGSWPLFGCSFWRPERHTLQPPVAATANPLLVVGTLHDPATPYTGAVAMATSLGTAELLTWEGNGHGAVGRSDCITRLVADYLVSLTIPPHETRCPA